MQCRLCPRECLVDRENGERGFCGETSQLRIASILPHFGEEPCITGRNGSGTVFFSGCSCGCFFCQNYQISHGGIGRLYSEDDFFEALKGLVSRGVHNLNFVTPDHFWPQIERVMRRLREEGVDIPFLWNTSAYCRAEMVRGQAKLVDVFLPDYKYALPELAETCMGDSRYPELALAAISEMVDAAGFLRPYDETGEITATRGVLVRHLVLPGQYENSIAVLDALYSHFGPRLPISIMSQFMPMPECKRRGMFTEKVDAAMYEAVVQHADDLGFTRVFTQIDSGDDAFAPDFTLENPFRGNKEALR